ncbi:hypothetical protein L9F63_015761, partial [Diploptera punctata]
VYDDVDESSNIATPRKTRIKDAAGTGTDALIKSQYVTFLKIYIVTGHIDASGILGEEGAGYSRGGEAVGGRRETSGVPKPASLKVGGGEDGTFLKVQIRISGALGYIPLHRHRVYKRNRDTECSCDSKLCECSSDVELQYFCYNNGCLRFTMK